MKLIRILLYSKSNQLVSLGGVNTFVMFFTPFLYILNGNNDLNQRVLHWYSYFIHGLNILRNSNMRIFLFLLFIGIPFVSAQTLTVRNDINDLVTITKNGITTLKWNGTQDVSILSERSGLPALPSYIYKMDLPDGTTIRDVNVLKAKEIQINGTFNIAPLQNIWTQELKPTNSEPNPEIYNSDRRWPEQIVQFTGVKSFNGRQIAHFVITPLQYNPVSGKLYFISEIQIAYSSATPQTEPVKPRSDSYTASLDFVFGNLNKNTESSPSADIFINSESVLFEGKDTYIIIAPQKFASALQPLADWKTQKGIPTIIRTLESIKKEYHSGVDLAEKIRNFIRWSYENRGTKYVLLAGDVEFVPSRNITTGGFTFATDYYFADLDGTWNADQDDIFGEAVDDLDGYPEVYVSRIPVRNTTDISRFITKLFRYEKLEGLSEDEDFPANVLYTAANLSHVNDGKNLITKHIDPEINPDFTRKMLTESDDIGHDPAVAKAEFNKNHGIIFTECHGTAYTIRPGGRYSNLYNYNFDELTNTMPGLYYIASCYTNDIRKRSISERWLLSPNGGGVAYIGNSSYEYPFSGIYLQKEFFNLAFTRGFYHLAEAHFLSRLIYLGYLNYEGPSRIIVYSTLVLGDPEMPIWTEKPSYFTVQSQDTVMNGQSRFMVRVIDKNNAMPVANASVVLYKNGVVYLGSQTDASGNASFPRNFLASDSVHLTISKHNYKPEEQLLNFQAQPGARLELTNYSFFDTNGDSVQVCEPGESAELYFQIINSGDLAVPGNYTIETSCSGAKISMRDSIAILSASIQPGEKQWIGPFTFQISNAFSEDSTMQIQAQFKEDSFIHYSVDIPLKISLPQMNADFTKISMVYWKPEPGRQLSSVGLELTNSGLVAAYDVQYSVSSTDTTVTISGISDSVWTLKAGEQIRLENAFLMQHAQAASGIDLTVVLNDSRGHSWSQKLNFGVPEPPQDLQFKPENATGIQLSWKASGNRDIQGYHVFRKTASEQTFKKITDKPLQNAGYFVDETVEPGLVYSYFVQAVDHSGNLSYSAADTILAWPTLPYQQNFPRQLSSAGIGAMKNGVVSYDLNNDGQAETIATGNRGALNVYNTDGSLRYSVEGLSGSLTVPAVGNVYGDGGKEIVAASYTEGKADNWVFIVDGPTGTLIHAIYLQYNAPTSVVLNDLDNDGLDEIILLTHAGAAPEPPKNTRLWIWKSTGSEWTSFRTWPEEGYTFGDNYSLGNPAVADMDNSGTFSIIVSTQVKGLFCFHPADTSEAVWIKTAKQLADTTATGYLMAPLSLADLDNDGNLDILSASVKNNKLYAVDRFGAALPGWETGIDIEVTDPWGHSSPAIIGNLDSDPEMEIVYVGREHLYILEHDGSSKTGWPIEIENGSSFYESGHGVLSPFNSPVLADLNQDGTQEIIFITAYGILHAIDSQTQKDIIGFPIDTNNDSQQAQSPMVDDIDRDGDLELLLIDSEGYLKIWDVPFKYGQSTELFWNQPYANVKHTGELTAQRIEAISAIDEDPLPTGIPSDFSLDQNFPNPFNPVTVINYKLSAISKVKLVAYNMLGQKIQTLVDKTLPAGTYKVSFNGINLASGIYFYRIQAGSFVKTRKMILLR